MSLPPLFKFLDVRGAKLSLANGRFRHAKPSEFNDTEELRIQSIFPEETEIALKKLGEEFNDVIVEHISDTPTCASPMREQIAVIQKIFRNNPAAIDVIKAEMAEEKIEAVYDLRHMRERAAAFVREINEFMQAHRVLCVSTRLESDRMWRVYAQNHQGIALQIEPNVAKDSKFQRFSPVTYREHGPSLYDSTRVFIADSLFGDKKAVLGSMMDKIVYTKTLEWEHESEYRLVIPLREGERPWDTLPYHPEEITKLCLG